MVTRKTFIVVEEVTETRSRGCVVGSSTEEGRESDIEGFRMGTFYRETTDGMGQFWRLLVVLYLGIWPMGAKMAVGRCRCCRGVC